MAVGDIGLGEAFVIDFSGLNQNINRQTAILQEQADRRYREVQEQNGQIADILSKVNLNGVRRADQPEILQAYRQLREKAIEAQTINDPYRKSLAIAQVRNGFSDIMAAAEASKQAQNFLSGVGQDISKNPALYNDDVVSQFREDFDKPLSKLGVDSLNPIRYQRRVDDSKVFDDLASGVQGLLKNQRGQVQVGERLTIGNQRATVVDTVSEVPLNLTADYILKKAEADPATAAYLKRTFPDMNQGEAALNLAQQLSQLGYTQKVQTETQRDARPRQSSSSSQDSEGSVDYGVPLPYRTDNPDLPRLEIPTARFKAIKSTNTPIAGARGVIDLDRGGRVNLPPTFEGDVSGITTVPVIRGGVTINGQDATGELAQESFVRQNPNLVSYEDFIVVNSSERRGSRTVSRSYLVPADRLSESSKTIREQVRSFRNTPIQPISTNQQNSVSSQRDPLGLGL